MRNVYTAFCREQREIRMASGANPLHYPPRGYNTARGLERQQWQAQGVCTREVKQGTLSTTRALVWVPGGPRTPSPGHEGCKREPYCTTRPVSCCAAPRRSRKRSTMEGRGKTVRNAKHSAAGPATCVGQRERSRCSAGQQPPCEASVLAFWSGDCWQPTSKSARGWRLLLAGQFVHAGA